MSTEKIIVKFNPNEDPLPLVSLVVASLLHAKIPKSVVIIRSSTHVGTVQAWIPKTNQTNQIISGDIDVARFIAQTADTKTDTTLCLDSKTEQLFIQIMTNISVKTLMKTDTTFLTGDKLTLAEIALWKNFKLQRLRDLPSNNVNLDPHINCFLKRCDSRQEFARANEFLCSPIERKNHRTCMDAGGSFNIDLPDAKNGNVVTRFPPEPSGYLHIGHVKAVLLNEYFARAYQGKLILRFDDTNPLKEKNEYVNSIITDLKTLGVAFDALTYTSDHFDVILQYGTQLLRDNLAYIDCTPKDQLRKDRMAAIESIYRSCSVDENLSRWNEMQKGSEEGLQCCMRAKIDMHATNRALRDPVLFRCHTKAHHRTGNKYIVYPTYDFACPIVDAIEGVTHALRTTEYHDRNDQYAWIQKACKLRTVHIWDFSRLNFVHTCLSKRKLQWLVDHKVVDGWSDPRMPTVQGIMRRGMHPDALRQFILLQGASKAVNLMEWDKIWSINRQLLEKNAHRYNAIAKLDAVSFTLVNLSDAEHVKTEALLHPKRPDMGTKQIIRTPTILIEQNDAKDMTVDEEVTLMSWGNAIIKEIQVDEMGVVLHIKANINPDGDVKTTRKKLTWVPNLPSELVAIDAVEFGHLINVPKVDKTTELSSVINRESRKSFKLLGEPAIAAVKANEVIQIQRRGFFRCDECPNTLEKTFFMVPDPKLLQK